MQAIAKQQAEYPPVGYAGAMEDLLGVVQQLSMARQLDEVTRIVRSAARRLAAADGATFVLREGDFCFYADEDAITPLWKGRRFPLNDCVSGWSMLNRQSVVIEDIYQDRRVPAQAYRPTFVKSLVMLPIRSQEPIGAIGVYWAKHRLATDQEVRLIQALADSTSVAMENVAVYNELEQRVRSRTEELERLNRELESFSSSVAHDLRAPLGVIEGYSTMLLDNFADGVPEGALQCIRPLPRATQRMRATIDGLLTLARAGRGMLKRQPVDLSAMATDVVEQLRTRQPDRDVEVVIQPAMRADGDPALLRSVLDNLIGNAWKYTAKVERACIEVRTDRLDGGTAYVVTDNGAGFDSSQKDRLFVPFSRLHASTDFPGIGIGLATVQKIIERHGGRVWAEASPGKGASFFFTIGS